MKCTMDQKGHSCVNYKQEIEMRLLCFFFNTHRKCSIVNWIVIMIRWLCATGHSVGNVQCSPHGNEMWESCMEIRVDDANCASSSSHCL